MPSFLAIFLPLSTVGISSGALSAMERQKSFSIKRTRLLLFFLTIPSSLLCCFLFSSWARSFTPSASREDHLQFSGEIRRINAPAFAASRTSLLVNATKNHPLDQAHLRKRANFTGKALNSGKDSIFGDANIREGARLSVEAWGPASDEKNSILDDAHLRKSTDFSQKSLDLVEQWKIGYVDDAHLGNSSGLPRGGLVSSTQKNGEKNIESDGVLNASNEEFERNYAVRNGTSENSSETSLGTTVGKVGREGASTCDVSDGRWVFDESYPMYTGNSCPYIDEGFSCEANGRLDRDYLKWRWQPHGCNIPRFDPLRMLELIRGKRLVFVGDSINRNQWESMLCMLRGAIKDPSRVYEARRRSITKNKGNYNFKFIDYHCSVEYYVSHFLVHESKARVGKRHVKTLRIDAIDRSSSRWRGADILVFNTAHWWLHHKTKAGVLGCNPFRALHYIQEYMLELFDTQNHVNVLILEGDQVHPRLDVSAAFRKALMTWASWVDRYVPPGKTQVFFRSSSPSHFSGGEWNSGGHCKESTQPLNDSSHTQNPEKNMIVEGVVKQMKTPVTILKVTSLSGFRIDGHPSIYGRNPRRGPPSNIEDCSHWCLPGVPDTWNELLYFHLLSKEEPFSAN